MPISVPCPCGKTLSVKDELAGKRGKCPACGTLLTIPQPPKVTEPEWGLAPLDEELEQRTKSLPQVSKPAAKPTPPAAQKNRGGPAPLPLDLPPLVDDLLAKPPIRKPPLKPAQPQANIKPSSATKPLGGSAPPPLDLAPLGGGEEHLDASWLEDEIESEFKVAGPPVSSATGQIFAPPSMAAPAAGPPGGHPGQLLCPYCNRDLERTVTTGNIFTQIVLGLFAGFYFTPTTPFRCRSCGPIKYEELVGESKQTAKKRSASMDRGCLYGALAVVGGFVLLLLGLMYAAGDFDSSTDPPPPATVPSDVEQRRKEYDRQFEELKKRNAENWRKSEEERRANEERLRKMRQQNRQEATPRPNPTPRPGNPATPLPRPRPAPPPMPMPMPVNPFQPID